MCCTVVSLSTSCEILLFLLKIAPQCRRTTKNFDVQVELAELRQSNQAHCQMMNELL